MLSFSMAAGSATALGRRPLGPVAVRAFLGRSSPSVSEPSSSFSSCAAFLPAAGRLRFAALLDAAEGRALRFEPVGVPPAPLDLRPPVDFLRELFGAANSSPEDCESNARCQMGRSEGASRWQETDGSARSTYLVRRRLLLVIVHHEQVFVLVLAAARGGFLARAAGLLDVRVVGCGRRKGG
jgi:hypothetical protein